VAMTSEELKTKLFKMIIKVNVAELRAFVLLTF